MALLIESTAFVTLFFSFVHYTNRAVILKQKKEAAANAAGNQNAETETSTAPAADTENPEEKA